jgi:hypothetical protein
MWKGIVRMRMRMGRRRSRGKEELVVIRDFRDLLWLLEEEDILVHYRHQHNRYIGSRADYSHSNPYVSSPNKGSLGILCMHTVEAVYVAWLHVH